MKRYQKGVYTIIMGGWQYRNYSEEFTQVFKGEEFIFATKNEELALKIMSGLAFLRSQKSAERSIELEFMRELHKAESWQLKAWNKVAEIIIGFAEDGDHDVYLDISLKDKWEERLKDIEEELERRKIREEKYK